MSQGPLYGYSAERLAQLTGSHLTTIRRWKRSLRPRRWLLRLIAVCIEGDLGEIDRAWRGWIIRRGELVSPENETFTPGMVRAAPLFRQRALELGRQVQALTTTVDSNAERQARVEKLAALQATLYAAERAFESMVDELTAREQQRLFEAHPATRERVARGLREVTSDCAETSRGP